MFEQARGLAVALAAPLVAIILHELAHGWAARAMGDGTAKLAGRLTLNPIRHVDPVGTLFLPAFLAVSQIATIGRVAFMFSWAKPVPVNPAALHLGAYRNPRRLMALVAVAGPAMNFALAFCGALAVYDRHLDGLFLAYFIEVNLLLGIFNLIPLPPLDGGRIAVGLLPLPAARLLAGAERYGIFAVLLLLFVLPAVLGQFGVAFSPLADAAQAVIPWAGNLVMHLAGHDYGL